MYCAFISFIDQNVDLLFIIILDYYYFRLKSVMRVKWRFRCLIKSPRPLPPKIINKDLLSILLHFNILTKPSGKGQNLT